jgi:hypothetical protein
MIIFTPNTVIKSADINLNFDTAADIRNWSNPYKFSAYRGTNQSITINTVTKINFATERFDTNNNYDSTTNYTYTAPVTGYYNVNAEVQSLIATAANVDCSLRIFINGVYYRKGSNIKNASYPQVSVNSLVYLLAGQYVDIRYYSILAADTIEGTAVSNTFEMHLVSAA